MEIYLIVIATGLIILISILYANFKMIFTNDNDNNNNNEKIEIKENYIEYLLTQIIKRLNIIVFVMIIPIIIQLILVITIIKIIPKP